MPTAPSCLMTKSAEIFNVQAMTQDPSSAARSPARSEACAIALRGAVFSVSAEYVMTTINAHMHVHAMRVTGSNFSLVSPVINFCCITALRPRKKTDKSRSARPMEEKYISPVTEIAHPATTTPMGIRSWSGKGIPNAQVRKADMTGLDEATTSEKAAETKTNAEFSDAIEKPNVLAIGRIPPKNSFLVGTGMGFPLTRFRCKSTKKAAEEETNK